jgi:hypothetical protein
VADPVSWLLIEPGWRVETADGEDAGTIEAVLGDQNADIFDGLAVATGLTGRAKYVPSEQVGEITVGTVRLSLDRAAVDSLSDADAS